MTVRSRRIGSAVVILMVGFVGSRLLGLVRDMVISNVFGTSPQLDAYFAAFRLPDFVFQILAGAALGSAFIPTFTTYLTNKTPDEAWTLANSVLNLIALVTLALSLLFIAVAPWIVPLIVFGFPPQQQDLVVQLTRIMLISPIFFSISGIIMGILNARHHFLFPALAPMVYNMSIILGTLTLGRSIGVYGLAICVAAGSALHLLSQLPALRSEGMVYKAIANINSPGVREVGRLMLPRVLGLSAVQVNFLVTTILASTLTSGSLAALNYAWLLVMMPLGIFGMSISTAVFPTMAEEVAAENYASLRRTISSTLRIILFLTIPASLGLILLREPIVALIFQRGLFNPESTRAVAWALMFYAIGLFAHSALEILTRGFYALHDTRTPVVLSIGSMVLNIPLCLVLMRFFQHGGLALSLSLSTIIETGLLFLLLRRRIGGLEDAELGKSLASVSLATGIMGIALVLFLVIGRFDLASLVSKGVAALGGIAVGAFVYVLVAWILRAAEVEMAARQLRLKRG